MGDIGAGKLTTFTVNNASTGATTIGDITAADTIAAIDIDASNTGKVVVGSVTGTTGSTATSLTVDIDLLGASSAANTFGALDIGADGTITDYNWNSGAINQANTVAAITALKQDSR